MSQEGFSPLRVEDLPRGDSPEPVVLPHFPARWQAVIWRNWGLVPAARLAAVLGMSETAARKEAARLGLDPEESVQEQWTSRCYLSVIRSNWHLLDYGQILQLLDWTPERLAQVLNEEDFFWSKLGRHKPAAGPVIHSELTPLQERETDRIRRLAERYFPPGRSGYVEPPLAFHEHYGAQEPILSRPAPYDFEDNFIHSYAASCGDVFLETEARDPVPEKLLEQYASLGVKGVWIHALLRHFYPVPGGEEYSRGREKRLENLRRVVARLKKHGLKLYLYFNEPRALPESFCLKHPEWCGWELPGGGKTVCTTRSPEPLKWLERGMEYLFSNVGELGGIFAIVMSENPTNCNYASSREKCPFCKSVPPESILAEILRAMERGVHRAAPDAAVIAYDWAWRPFRQSTENVPFKTAVLKLLPPSIRFGSVSEWGMITETGGVRQYLKDYSISHPGPSAESRACWEFARSRGMKTVAKIQVNNSWELAAVPYLPVPYLIQEHLRNLNEAGVNGLILSWTLGGFLGGNLRLLNSTPEEIAAFLFHPALAEKVCAAWRIFSDSFREYPFHNSSVLYRGPCNYGPKNLLHLKKTGYAATMLGFPYDDLESWRGPYPEEVLERQFELVSSGWKKGLDLLEQGKQPEGEREERAFRELLTVAEASYCHLRSAYLQIRFVIARDHGFRKEVMAACAREESRLALKLHELARRDSRIGFEASNHYFYSLNDLREKVISCEALLRQLE